jgi:hypothetical protein
MDHQFKEDRKTKEVGTMQFLEFKRGANTKFYEKEREKKLNE